MPWVWFKPGQWWETASSQWQRLRPLRPKTIMVGLSTPSGLPLHNCNHFRGFVFDKTYQGFQYRYWFHLRYDVFLSYLSVFEKNVNDLVPIMAVNLPKWLNMTCTFYSSEHHFLNFIQMCTPTIGPVHNLEFKMCSLPLAESVPCLKTYTRQRHYCRKQISERKGQIKVLKLTALRNSWLL